MTRTVIVAVGGTGQWVLHYYVQLYQIGAIEDPFYAIVIDSDKLWPSLEILRQFWQSARLAHPDSADVAQLEYFPIAQNLKGQVLQAVVGGALPSPPIPHPAEAFFDSSSLKQDVKEGLYARPALSAVVQTDWSTFPLSSLAGYDRVLIVGSLIGGTGGGLIAPVLNQLALRSRTGAGADQPRLRALVFGEYFRVTGNSPVPDASTRYPSNKLLVAHSLERLSPAELDHFMFVEPATPIERDTGKERNPENLAWPNQAHPIWTGVSGLEELRTNTTWPNEVGFLAKEKVPATRDLARDETILKHSISLAQTIAIRLVLTKIPSEPWFTRFYGRSLPMIIASAYSASRRKPSLGITSLKMLCRELQSEYEKCWTRVKRVFPALSASDVTPEALRGIPWDRLKSEVPELTDSRDSLIRSTTALLLHRALRGGRA